MDWFSRIIKGNITSERSQGGTIQLVDACGCWNYQVTGRPGDSNLYNLVTILYKQMHRTLVTYNQMVGNNFGKRVPGKTVHDGTDHHHPKTSSRGPSPGARDSRQGIWILSMTFLSYLGIGAGHASDGFWLGLGRDAGKHPCRNSWFPHSSYG